MIDLTGKVFGRLTVLGRAPNIIGLHKRVKPQWYCKCECGKIVTKGGENLRRGYTNSCGCFAIEWAKKKKKEVIIRNDNRYRVWCGMKERCYNIKDKKYANYGGRAIKVCDRWLNSFHNFCLDMGDRPSEKHTLDRFPNNDNGNYEPNNCRWATSEEQCRNKRNNVWIEYNGVKMIMQDWAKYFNTYAAALTYKLKHTESFEEIYNFYKLKNAI